MPLSDVLITVLRSAWDENFYVLYFKSILKFLLNDLKNHTSYVKLRIFTHTFRFRTFIWPQKVFLGFEIVAKSNYMSYCISYSIFANITKTTDRIVRSYIVLFSDVFQWKISNSWGESRKKFKNASSWPNLTNSENPNKKLSKIISSQIDTCENTVVTQETPLLHFF